MDASYRSTAPSDPAGVSAAELAQFPLVLGLDTFGDLTHDEDDRPLSHAQTIRNVVEQGVLAGQAGADFFGIGEHHADDFPMPGAGVVPGAIAARTTRIHLRSAVTVWSSDDPLRVASVTPRSTPSPAAGPKSSRTGLLHRPHGPEGGGGRSGRPAQLEESEVPGRLRHRAPLLALSADVEAAMPPAGQRRVVVAGPAPDLQHGSIRAARVDEDAHSVPDSDLVAEDHTAPFAEAECPGCAAGAELEGALHPERGRMVARLAMTGPAVFRE